MRLTALVKSRILDRAQWHWRQVKAMKLPDPHARGINDTEYMRRQASLAAAQKAHERELTTYLEQLRMVLDTFSTLESLRESWPEIEPLLDGVPTSPEDVTLVIYRISVEGKQAK